MRAWLGACLVTLGSSLALTACAATRDDQQSQRRPNIVLILADDLGWGELGCYGQAKIRTPHIDRLALEGLRFTQAYAGAPVCAPSRCVLLTGRHSANAEIRGNKEVHPEGQHPLSSEVPTFASLLRGAGYATAAIGKWGLGPVGSTGDPNSKGFDLFFGYNCQREAHTYFPGHLWRNAERIELNGGVRVPGHARLAEPTESDGAPLDFAPFRGSDYAPEAILAEAERFLREQGDAPFLLYLPFVEPHLALQPPPEWVDAYPEEWDTEPYLGDRGYTPHPRPRAGYAALISDLDEHVGRVLDLLDELELAEDTLVLFTSDNGATHDVGGVDTEFFHSVGPLRGRKGSVYEGGLRVPFLARWPGVVQAGIASEHVLAFQDVLPTLCELSGAPLPSLHDGLSFVPALTGRGEQLEHPHLTWEFAGYGGQKAVRMGSWKAVLRQIHAGNAQVELYDLERDPAEGSDLAELHPDLVARANELFAEDRSPSATFPMAAFQPSGKPHPPSAQLGSELAPAVVPAID